MRAEATTTGYLKLRALLLAEAGTKAAAVLADMDLSAGGFEDRRLARAQELAQSAAAHSRRARGDGSRRGRYGSRTKRGASDSYPGKDHR